MHIGNKKATLKNQGGFSIKAIAITGYPGGLVLSLWLQTAL